MTIWEFVRVALRYWLVVIIGAICTIGAGWAAVSDNGVYFSRTEIAFLAPASTLYPNSLRTQSVDVIMLAGAVGKRLSGPIRPAKFADPSVTLVGLGLREGWALGLRDTGGQWATNFATQSLVLDVVGPSETAVHAQQQDIIRQVRDELNEMQRAADVDPVNAIVALPAPESPQIYHVTGNRPRTLGMTAVLGVVVTVATILTLDRLRQRRRDSPQ